MSYVANTYEDSFLETPTPKSAREWSHIIIFSRVAPYFFQLPNQYDVKGCRDFLTTFVLLVLVRRKCSSGLLLNTEIYGRIDYMVYLVF